MYVSVIMRAWLYLELAVDLVVEGAEQLLAVGLGVGGADGAALRGVAMGQDGDDEPLVRAPPCETNEIRRIASRNGAGNVMEGGKADLRRPCGAARSPRRRAGLRRGR
jgi:hypothetical protein